MHMTSTAQIMHECHSSQVSCVTRCTCASQFQVFKDILMPGDVMTSR